MTLECNDVKRGQTLGQGRGQISEDEDEDKDKSSRTRPRTRSRPEKSVLNKYITNQCTYNIIILLLLKDLYSALGRIKHESERSSLH